MSPRKRNGRKKSKTIVRKISKKGLETNDDIPVLTRRAPPEAVDNTPEIDLNTNTVDTSIDYNQEIRALVTVAVNESVPQMVDTIMAKLMQPIGTDPTTDE